MSTVNGYHCTNCSDELLAKRGVDPRQGTLKTQLTEHAMRAGQAEAPDALRDDRGAIDGAPRAQPIALGVNAPTPSEALGTRLNLRA